jgi:hypothetical protein
MTYITNTINSANPSADLYTALAAALTSAGYTLEDTVVISTRTHKIWKSPAAGNAANKDWFVDIAYATSGAGHLYVIPMENYDAANDLAIRMVYGGAGDISIDPTTFSRYGDAGYSLEHSNWRLSAAGSSNMRLNTAAGTAFGYWISVTGTRIAGITSVVPTDMLYAGLYELDPLHATIAGADAFPLILAMLNANGIGSPASTVGSATAALTRIPKATDLVGNNSFGWAYIPYVRPVHLASVANQPGFPGLPSDSTEVAPRAASRLLVISSTSKGSLGFVGPLGLLYDVAAVASTATVVRGDTVTIAGNTWVLGSSGSSGDSSSSILLRAA